MVFEQAIYSVALAGVLAVALVLALAALLPLFQPTVLLRIEAESVTKSFLGGLIIALLAASLPIRQISRLDPAAVFRR